MNHPRPLHMIKAALFCLLLSLAALPLAAEFVQPDAAANAARTWLREGPAQLRGPLSVELTSQLTQETFQPCAREYEPDGSELPLLYLVEFAGGSFVLMSADDNGVPVLAWSVETNAQAASLPPSFLDWVGIYARQLSLIAVEGTIIPEHQSQWSELLAGSVSQPDRNERFIQPLMSTNWDQGWPYNELCPADPEGPGGHVYAGCVATAMAMVMKYWNHPVNGVGNHSYYMNGYGYQSANFGATTYLWDQMPDSVGSSNLPIATLLYHLGVSVDMGYAPDGSGAQSSDAADALVQYFKYPNAALHDRGNYTDNQWNSLLASQLDNGSPIYYSGHGSGGHAFVIDGYSANAYYHFNFGWSGAYNGYYYMNSINPGGSDFNDWNAAILNSIPENYSIANTRVRMNAGAATVGNSFNLGLSTYPLLGSWNVSHFDLDLLYDSNFITFSGASVDGTIASAGVLTVSETTPGIIHVNWEGPSSLVGGGDLINFSFLPLEAGDYLFDVSNMHYNTTQVTNTEYVMQTVAAPVANLAASEISMLNVMHLGYLLIGSTEIRTTYLLPSWDVDHYQFDLAYDPLRLQFHSLDVSNTLSAGAQPAAVVNFPGNVSITCDLPEAISGQGTLLKVNFQAIGNGPTLLVTQVTPQNFYYNDTQITNLGSANYILSGGYTPVEDELAPPPPGLTVSPNPVRGSATISFSGKSGQPLALQIYNLRGQLIDSQVLADPTRELTWDAVDKNGIRLASGVYYLRWQQGENRGQSKLLLLD